MSRHSAADPRLPPRFPFDWASDWGEDRHGPWVAFRHRGVRQCLRWVPPGAFLMGSPEKEPGRMDDERQHQVTLTRGLWLADTACTQSLWQSVMGDNPSEFQGDERPVEKVSWEDIQGFFERLGAAIPGLDPRLPTEAEWERACRAGTETPFWFGDRIGTDQVNCNAYIPYDKGPRGEYRGRTVEVKSLPCNGWGLYEMHGNVEEWCQDRYGAYPNDAAEDPTGPETGVKRVLRGGSWYGWGTECRSAQRSPRRPAERLVDLGFRLARGPG
jgi:formylglycine-generating enzyme